MIIEGVSDGVLLVDPLGFVQAANGAAARMFGSQSAALIGREVRLILPSPRENSTESALQTQDGQESPRSRALEFRGLRFDGKEFPVELSVGSLRVADRPMIVTVVRDVTQRKRAEARAMRRREARLTEEERASLVQDLHDGLLQTLTGATLRLKSVERMVTVDPAAAAERIGDVIGALSAEQRELRFWVSDLKDGHPVDRVRGRLARRLRATLDRIGSTWGIETSLTYAPKRRPPASVARQIYRLVQEAAVNAARHSGATLVTVQIAESGSDLKIRVSDNGNGFPFQGSFGPQELAERRLGPVLLKHRIARAAGTLAIESTPRGACLTILIPIRDGA
jgi:PAS domain S-box-containing protein